MAQEQRKLLRLGLKWGEVMPVDELRIREGATVGVRRADNPSAQFVLITPVMKQEQAACLILFAPDGAGYRLRLSDDVTGFRMAEEGEFMDEQWLSLETLEKTGRATRDGSARFINLLPTHGSIWIGTVQIIFQFLSPRVVRAKEPS